MENQEFEKLLPGYETVSLPNSAEKTPLEWRDQFETTSKRVINFINARDGFAILARTSILNMMQSHHPRQRMIEQAELELIQGLMLLRSFEARSVPTSPANYERFWPLLGQSLIASVRMHQRQSPNDDLAQVAHRLRFQTAYYRNAFYQDDCRRTMLGILAIIDGKCIDTLGYKLSEVYAAIARISELVLIKLDEFLNQVRTVCQSNSRNKVEKAVSFFLSSYPPSQRAWRYVSRFTALQQLKDAGFQLSELCYPAVFTISRQSLLREFDRNVVDAIFQLAADPGTFTGNTEDVYRENPAWTSPFLRTKDDHLFAAIPQMPYAFPFRIVEALIPKDTPLQKAYQKARSEYLEIEIVKIIETAAPSARVYRSVIWCDPETGADYENDVVALVGNFLFVFEAKSGAIFPATRRGGEKSIAKDFKQLFVKPGIQAWRLQNYLGQHQHTVVLRTKADGKPIDLRLGTPKVIHRFTICYESFGGLTSAHHHLKRLGYISDETAWSPVLSLGELQMIARYLDTEISFVHYLSRRFTLEKQLNFDGDEQDLLSIYLTNRFCFDENAIKDRQIHFYNADMPVRTPMTPHNNRKRFFIHGLILSAFWEKIARSVSVGMDPTYRFDTLNTLLNQDPSALSELEKRLRRFRRGDYPEGQEVVSIRTRIAEREFVLTACYLRTLPSTREWRDLRTMVASEFGETVRSIDTVSIVFLRTGKTADYDLITFSRFNRTLPVESV